MDAEGTDALAATADRRDRVLRAGADGECRPDRLGPGRLGVDPVEALDRPLRATAFVVARTVSAVARDVVTHQLGFRPETDG
ncbi:hypothetical protein [Streptomyces sp. NPDC005017]|uniref:hypothetical protein n=1 Tax=Streptomyces sp. NPDC005017 TaxID=3364706 RepID=UPI0036BE90FA